MKKYGILAILIASLLLAGAAASAQTTIRYWLFLDDATDPMLSELISSYENANPGVKIDVQIVPLDQFHDRLATSLIAGSAPDVARFKDWWLGEFVQAGILEPLAPYFDRWNGYSDVVESLWNSGMVPGDDNIYMMPHQYITFYMYYRKDWFNEAGLTAPLSFDAFLDAALKLTKPNERQYGFGLRGGGGGQDQWYAFMLGGGARMQDPTGRVIINDATGLGANQWYIDLFREHKVAPPSSPTDAYAQVIGAFQSGITAMMAHHVGSSVIMTDHFGDAVGVTRVPSIDPAKPATMSTMSGHVMLKTASNKEAAFDFLAYLTEHEAMDRWSRSRQGQLPVLHSVANQPHYQENEFFRLSLEAGAYAHTWPPLPGVGYVSSQLWQTEMQRALLGQTTSKGMLDAIATALATR